MKHLAEVKAAREARSKGLAAALREIDPDALEAAKAPAIEILRLMYEEDHYSFVREANIKNRIAKGFGSPEECERSPEEWGKVFAANRARIKRLCEQHERQELIPALQRMLESALAVIESEAQTIDEIEAEHFSEIVEEPPRIYARPLHALADEVRSHITALKRLLSDTQRATFGARLILRAVFGDELATLRETAKARLAETK